MKNYIITSRAVIKCKTCGKSFSVANCRKEKAKYCSFECYWNNGRKKVKCLVCGTIFVSHKFSKKKLCSLNCRNRNLKENPYWLGKNHKEETKKRLSNIHKGKRLSPRTEFKKGNVPYNNGEKRPEVAKENHWNWQGGITAKLKALRQTLEYKQWRKAIFERDNYTCVFCGKKSKKAQPVYLQADHIKPFALYPELRFDLDNGRTLCNECHSKTPTYKNGSLGRDRNTGKFYSLLNE